MRIDFTRQADDLAIEALELISGSKVEIEFTSGHFHGPGRLVEISMESNEIVLLLENGYIILEGIGDIMSITVLSGRQE